MRFGGVGVRLVFMIVGDFSFFIISWCIREVFGRNYMVGVCLFVLERFGFFWLENMIVFLSR